MTHQIFKINGMHCNSCVNRIQTRMAKEEGIQDVEVTLQPPQMRLQGNKQFSLTALNNLLGQIGAFSAEDVETARPTVPETTETANPTYSLATFKPLLLILGYILGVVLLVAFKTGNFSLMTLMQHYMAGFFLAFSFFKMLDVKGFASSFSMYDPIASRIPQYGFIYPFIELGLGIAYLLGFNLTLTNLITLVLVSIGTIGVLQSVLSKTKIRCACLGTVFNLPMTTVTIIENSMMIVMALGMLLLGS